MTDTDNRDTTAAESQSAEHPDQQTEKNNPEIQEKSHVLQKETIDSLNIFIKELNKLFPVLEIKNNIRVTHQGLFASEQILEPLLKAYQIWLEKQTAGEVHKSHDKAKKRLFGSSEPEGFYLIEGKNTMSGHLISFECREPMKFGLPTYLGPLSSKKSFLHQNDPVIKSLKDVELSSSINGTTLKIKVGNNIFTAEQNVINYFLHTARNSSRTLQDFPELNDSLAVQCKAFVLLLRKSKYINADQLLLVPDAYSQPGKYTFRILGSMVFIADKKFNIVSVYGLRGKDLYRLFRREFSSIRQRRLGSFEIYSDKHRLLGEFKYTERHYQLSTQALMDFILEALNSPDKRDKLKGIITARRVFERFSEIFQMSQPIQKHLIKSYLAKFKKPVYECRINGVWIFAMSRDAVIEAVIPKF